MLLVGLESTLANAENQTLLNVLKGLQDAPIGK
jgi:hypothetical protein